MVDSSLSQDETTQQFAIKCSGDEDLARCLQQAADSPTPVTLDLNQLTLAQPEHLDALRQLCTNAASHVTLSNGVVVLGGSERMLDIRCSRLSFKRMEIVRSITATPPPPPKATPPTPPPPVAGMPPGYKIVDGADSMLYVFASDDHAIHVTLEDCTLRMEGDPRYNLATAVFAHGASLLRMDRCKLLNMHSVVQIVNGAQVELNHCRVDMVFGINQQVTVMGAGSKLSLHGCTLVEGTLEEGTVQPPASSLQRLTKMLIALTHGAALDLVNTRVRMPLGAQLARVPYTVVCTNSSFTAADCTFEGTRDGVPDVNWHALALVRCDSAADLVIEDCTFMHAPDRTAIQCLAMHEARELPAGPLSVSIKGCEITNCFIGIEVPKIGQHSSLSAGLLDVLVEDTTIEITPSPITPQQGQACLYLEGHVVSATIRRCVIKAQGLGEEEPAVYVNDNTRLVMTDCTVSLARSLAKAVSLGGKGQPVDAVIERTTITTIAPDGAVSDGGGIQSVVFTRDGTTKLIDCMIQGPDSLCAVTLRGPGRVEMVRCEIAPERPMLMPWAAVEFNGLIILKDCSVGDCKQNADVYPGTFLLLDNTPYPPFSEAVLPHTPPPAAGTRQVILFRGNLTARSETASVKTSMSCCWTYITEREPTGGQAGSSSQPAGPATATAAGAEGSSSGGAGSGTSKPLVVPGGPWWPTKCSGCGATAGLSWCQGCTCVRYCSVKCQKQCWRDHKPLCQYISQHYGRGMGAPKVSRERKKAGPQVTVVSSTQLNSHQWELELQLSNQQ